MPVDPAVIVRDTLLAIEEKKSLTRRMKPGGRRTALRKDIKMLSLLISHIANGDAHLCEVCDGQRPSKSCHACHSTGVIWPLE